MIGSFALARFAIERTPAVTELRELECCPVINRQLGDEPSHHAGFADVPRMSADNNNCHYSFLPNLAKLAKLLRYSRSGLAGVPQNAIPFPRKIFFGNTPACPPSSTPSWMQ